MSEGHSSGIPSDATGFPLVTVKAHYSSGDTKKRPVAGTHGLVLLHGHESDPLE